MTRITIYKSSSKNGDIVGFKSEGHSGYARSGKDIVCAATSALVINTINSIEKFTEANCTTTVDDKNAIISMMVESNESKESLVLLQSLELGLSEIARDNPKYISITFEEV